MHRTGCQREDHPRIGRRELLQVGALGLFGAGLSDLLRLEAQAAKLTVRHRASAKAVVFIFQSGGPSQHETIDPKPDAPDGIRGEYGVTATRLPGVHFCEYLPRLADRANRFAIVRTMHHIAGREFRNEHNSCHYLLHSGSTALPPGDTNASIGQPRLGRFEWPSIGSLIDYALTPETPSPQPSPPAAGGEGRVRGALLGTGLPAVVELPRGNNMKYPGRGPGILGPRYSRWGVNLAPPCRAPDPAGSCPNCFSHDDPNDPERKAGKGPKAWWDNTSCRNPDFHLPDLASDGFSLPQIEDRTALLKRLDDLRRGVESADRAGGLDSWDAHRHQAMQLLLASRPGRHHWGDVFPCFFAGGGIRPGQVVGQTDKTGGLPATEPYTPADLAATIFHLLGVGPHEEFHDAQGRPYRIYQGDPISPLLA